MNAPMNAAGPVIELRRDDITQTRAVKLPPPALRDGRVRLRVDHFALTANTVTYAVTGDLLGYWDFFPATEPGWGRVPAMGHAEVVESSLDGVPVGMRCYGWFPMAGMVDFQATPTRDGFRDDGPHRAAHAPIYRSYTDTRRDPLHLPGSDGEYRHALLRGLYLTAYLADAELAAADYHGAEQVIVLSASSKTAIGMAERAAARQGLKVIGLTSTSNLDFVQRLPYYDEVLDYDRLADIDPRRASVIVDMAGNRGIVAALHAHLGDALRRSLAIGRSHHDAPKAAVGGAVKPEFFFAPTQARRLVEELGRDGFLAAVAEALNGFVEDSRQWLEIERVRGKDAAMAAWQRARSGAVAPQVGLIVSLLD